MSSTAGRFIVFEGGEGTGKSTQAALLAERIGAVLTREPGGTEFGARLREVLLASSEHEVPMTDRAEALLMAADRAQHVAQVLRPSIDAGVDVVCDRYIGSTVAYQGAGRGLNPTELAGISSWASGGLVPDLVVLLTVDAATAAERIGPARDRIEAAGPAFHWRVADSFVEQAAAAPERWRVLNGAGTVDEVCKRVWRAVVDRWPELESDDRG